MYRPHRCVLAVLTALTFATTTAIAAGASPGEPPAARAEPPATAGRALEPQRSVQPRSPVEALPAARWMRETPWAYPAAEILHILGFVLLVGTVIVFDLRVFGLRKRIAVTELARLTLPWSLASLLVVVPTGLVMFSAYATDFIASRVFVLKMLLLFCAGCNTVFFHVGPYQTVRHWDTHLPAPFAARASAAASLVLWAGVIACGRLLAYV